MIASEKGHIDVVRMLLDAGANVNACNDCRRTALMVASKNGHAEMVRMLLDAGANVNARDDGQ